MADKSRQKVQEVAIGKRVETVQGQVSIPVEQERVTIERIASTDTRSVVSGDVPFGVGESRIETYGEVPEIRKQAFVREDIKINKEIERETATAQEQVRHEELDIHTQRSRDDRFSRGEATPTRHTARSQWRSRSELSITVLRRNLVSCEVGVVKQPLLLNGLQLAIETRS